MADSIRESVGDAVKAAIDALALTYGTAPTAVRVVKRKLPALPEGKTPVEITVTVAEEGETKKVSVTQDLIRYPVGVTIVSAGGTALADDPRMGQWRQLIRKALQTRANWTTVTGWNTVSSAGKSPFDPAALAKDLNFSTQTFTVEVLEGRT